MDRLPIDAGREMLPLAATVAETGPAVPRELGRWVFVLGFVSAVEAPPEGSGESAAARADPVDGAAGADSNSGGPSSSVASSSNGAFLSAGGVGFDGFLVIGRGGR